MLSIHTLIWLIFAGTAAAQQTAPPAAASVSPEWQEQIRKGRTALANKDVEAARTIFEAVRDDALRRRDDAAGLAAVRMLSLLWRASADWPKTEELLAEAFDCAGRLHGYKSNEAVEVMLEIASVRRARGNYDGAAAILEQALDIVSVKGEPERSQAVKIATTLGLVHLERNDKDGAKEFLDRAIRMSDEVMQEGPELAPALEALGGVLRDESEYGQAAPLFERSLRIREIAFGPYSAELIAALDNLAYVYFGSMRFADAEPLYKRLLSIWMAAGGPDHPMAALTMDKMAEFYSAQKRFEEADEMAKRAADIRAGSFVGSLRLRARLAAQLSRPEDAIGFTEKALQVIDIAGLPRPEPKVLPAPPDAQPLLPAKPKARRKSI